MSIDFDKKNLEAAVTAVIERAASLNQAELHNGMISPKVNLRDRDEVRQYLKSQVKNTYERSRNDPNGIQIARIEAMPYRGIGFVFEQHNESIRSQAEDDCNAEEKMEHVAYFWSNLSFCHCHRADITGSDLYSL